MAIDFFSFFPICGCRHFFPYVIANSQLWSKDGGGQFKDCPMWGHVKASQRYFSSGHKWLQCNQVI